MKAGGVVTVEVDQLDALSVGLSLITIAKRRAMPAETCAIYERVGRQLVAAARAATVEPSQQQEVTQP